MDTELVPMTFRVPVADRQRLREILMRGGLTLQDFGSSVVDRALGRRLEDVDPLGGVAMLRNSSPRNSFRSLGRKMVLGE